MQNTPKPQLKLFSVIIMLDLLSACMTVPLFPILVKNPEIGLLGSEYSFEQRTLINGYIFGFFAIAQFFGSPIIGALSDRIGRKTVLNAVFVINVVTYIAIALGIELKSLEIFFAARILMGLLGNSIMIEQSSIADVSTPENKAKNLGIVGASFGIGLIVGPVISTVLSDSSIYKGFNITTPFYAILVINIINLALMNLYFKETLPEKNKKPISIFIGVKNIKRAFTTPTWRRLFLVVFFISVGFMFFLQFFQFFLMEKFKLEILDQGLLIGFCGLWMAISQGGILRFLTRYMTAEKLLYYSLPLLALAYLTLLIPKTVAGLYITVPVLIIFQGITFPSVLSIISNKASAINQGETIGINQSVQSMASALPALLVASFVSDWINFPMIFGSACTMVAAIIYLLQKKKTITN